MCLELIRHHNLHYSKIEILLSISYNTESPNEFRLKKNILKDRESTHWKPSTVDYQTLQ